MSRFVYSIVGLSLFAPLALAAIYSGGSGTETDPYKISTPDDWQQLIATSTDWDKQFTLLNDIDFVGTSLTPIAPDTDQNIINFQGIPFTGVFHGNNHFLRKATLNLPGQDYVGLFGYLGNGGIVHHLNTDNISISGRHYLGGLCGRNSGSINNCSVSSAVSGYAWIGGICGDNDKGVISECYAASTVVGVKNSSGIGGLCGGGTGTIVGSYASGSVSGGDFSEDIGGLCGLSYTYSVIQNSYATCQVSGGAFSKYIGGLCGQNQNGSIDSCYSTGTVVGGSSVGGLVGLIYYGGTVTASYWDKQSSGCNSSAGGTSLTTSEMKTLSPFIAAGWDFVGEQVNGLQDIWIMPIEEGYPILSWQTNNQRILNLSISPSPVFNVISWNTPKNADSVVQFGPTEALGLKAIGNFGTGHRVVVPSSPGPLYWRPSSTDSSGQTVYGEMRIDTVAHPTAVKISNVTATVTGPISAVISWTTSVPTAGTDKVYLRHLDVVQIPMLSLASSTSRHSISFNNLHPNLPYYYKVSSEGAGPSPEYSFTTGSVGITDVSAKPTLNRAFISWKTSAPATSIVEYEPAGTDGLSSVSNGGMTTSHQLEITKLKSASSYRYQVKSVDAQRNASVSDWKTFTTFAPLGSGGSTNQENPTVVNAYSNLKKLPGGQYQVNLSFTNTSNIVYGKAYLSQVYLGGRSSSSPLLPYTFGSISPGQVKTVKVIFPSSAGNSGNRVDLRWNGYAYNDDPQRVWNYNATYTVTLP